jgi:hypothetical protein
MNPLATRMIGSGVTSAVEASGAMASMSVMHPMVGPVPSAGHPRSRETSPPDIPDIWD